MHAWLLWRSTTTARANQASVSAFGVVVSGPSGTAGQLIGAEPPVPRGSRLTRSNRFSTDSGTHDRRNGVYSRPGSPGPPGWKISEPIGFDCSLCRARMICNVICSASGWA